MRSAMRICVSLMVVSSKMLLRRLVLKSDPKMCDKYFAPRLYDKATAMKTTINSKSTPESAATDIGRALPSWRVAVEPHSLISV